MDYSFEQASELFERHLEQVKWDRKVDTLYAPVDYILRLKAKRVRPALVLMGYNLFNESIEHALDAALAIEVFHNFTLLHDDIMDNADIRRGKPVANKIWGNNASILSGDAMLIESYRCLEKYSTMKEYPYLIKSFSQCALGVCQGQQYDMNFEKQSDVDEQSYVEMIRLKTAILLAQSLRIGGLIAGANGRDCDLMAQFGEQIGVAFQLRDDLLDVYSDTEKFGKRRGGDILSNKKTYLLIKARSLANEKQKTTIDNWYSGTQFDSEEKINAIVGLFDELNIKEVCQAQVERYSESAYKALGELSVSELKKRPLYDLAHLMMNRES